MHFIRHGQSEFNIAIDRTGRDPGINDAALTPHGVKQAEHAAQTLIGQGVTDIICSPYTRALQTASIIARPLGARLHIEPLIGERSLYSCDIGTPASRLKQSWQHLDFADLPEQWWPELNEPHAGLARRADAFLTKWRGKAQSNTFALVSHWYFLNHLTSYAFENGEVKFKKLF